MDWFGGVLLGAAIVLGIWLLLVAFIWLHRPSRHLAGATLRLLPDVLRMLRALIADPATPRAERWMLIGLTAWLASISCSTGRSARIVNVGSMQRFASRQALHPEHEIVGG